MDIFVSSGMSDDQRRAEIYHGLVFIHSPGPIALKLSRLRQADTRVPPHPEEPVKLDPQLRLMCDVGAAHQFSAVQLHSTVPNTSPLNPLEYRLSDSASR